MKEVLFSRVNKRAIDILQLMSEGMCRKEAAKHLKIAFKTVEGDINRIKPLFGAKDTVHLVAILFRENLLK